MAKYLLRGSYTTSGVQGLIKDGGVRRREIIEKAVASMGGTMEAFYYAFGEDDFFLIMNLPDEKAAIAASLTSAASGTVTNSITVLIEPEAIDEALKLRPDYTAPGQ